jgi:hypothetical protein
MKQSCKYPVQATPRNCHPLLQLAISPTARLVLLILYDAVIILVLALRIYTFLVLVASREEFCYTHSNATYQYRKSPRTDRSSPATHRLVHDIEAQCQWYNSGITSAGGCASAVAALLAATHLAAIAYRLLEPCYVWITALQSKLRKKSEATTRQDAKTDWYCSPRNVDIHTRDVLASERTGRWTQISEEEYDAGGVARRRRMNNSKGEGSETSEASPPKLENVLLECLVP